MKLEKFVALMLIPLFIPPISGNDEIISDWADGYFTGIAKMNNNTLGNVEGYIWLGRNDFSGNISGIFKGKKEIKFEGFFYKSLILCKPFFGILKRDEKNFQAFFITLNGFITVEGGYYASFLPKPRGNYSIGVREIHLVDYEREEKLTEIEGDRREMMLYLWYPTEESEGMEYEYMGKETFKWLLKQSYLFWIPENSYEYVKTHSFLDAKIADGVFPLIIFSHGYRGYPSMYTSMIEEIVSHGFVVAGICHPHIAGITVFPDGRKIEFTDLSSYNESYRNWWLETAFNEVIGDINYVIDYLLKEFPENIDGENIGIYGHSFGGGAALAMCADERIKAGLAMDGYFRNSKVEKPFFMFFVEGRFENDEFLQGLWENSSIAFTAIVNGSAHYDYTDLPVLLPHFAPNIPKYIIPGFGRIEGKRIVNIVNKFTLAFFNVYLKGESIEEIISLSDEFEEVLFYYKF
ncbi:MAG: hypothetical protein H5T45_02630 [Thermoplasmatales archaeon]|nr:hypothetical protein [Thermoplasmatales archaeon]